MRLVALTATVFASAIFIASHSPTAHAAAAPTSAAASQTKQQQIITVKPGDYLYKLAKAYNSTVQRMYDANTVVQDPDLIYPNEQLRVPSPDEQLTPRTMPGDTPATPVADVDQTPAPAAQTTSTPAPAPDPAPVAPVEHTAHVAPKPAAPAAAPTTTDTSVWDRIAQCESGGDWSINTGNGFYGGLQFTLSSWRAVGGSGYPNEASKAEQIMRAEKLQAMQGWGAWPVCSHKAGLL